MDSVGQGFTQGTAGMLYLCSTMSGATAAKTPKLGAVQGLGAGMVRRLLHSQV